MQDIVFYAAANETLGIVRDYANVRNQSAPVLTLGVSVCLRIRLFAATEGAAPYPIASFNNISNWEWSMDGDFDRSTASKLVADEGNISVHTVTDTVNGETRSFTEFVIPISNMNTQELAAWLGTEKTRSGLTGELVGYDSSENAAFVLQIENFTVRNRVAGLGDPTILDQEIVTRTQAERMIQTAVSSSAATKQDKLTSANGGTGISVSSSGVISVSNVPQSTVTGLTASLAGLSASLAAKQNTLSAGYRMAIVSGSTVEQARYFAIEPAITAPANQTTTVVLSAGKAYEIHAVATNARVLLNREEPVGGTHTFALEGHAEIFVANTGYIQTGSNVVLSQPLEPDAINYCTVRFRGGMAVISVEDHLGGYIVVSSSGSASGSLPYALASAGSSYIAFNATLAGFTIDMGGVATNVEKHVVGNGYADTILTGGVSCTSKTTFANLTMSNVVNSGGTMTLGDVYIPSGSTVAVSGGGLAVERVSGNGGTIDLGGTNIALAGKVASASGCSVVNGSALYGGGILANGGANLTLRSAVVSGCKANTGGGLATYGDSIASCLGCLITGNYASGGFGGGVGVVNGSFTLESSVVSGNDATYGGNDAVVENNGTLVLKNGNTVSKIMILSGGVVVSGSNTVGTIVGRNTSEYGSVTISSGAIIDLTGNTNATPIAPGGGVTFAEGGATVYPSAGSASAYTLGGMTVHEIGNTNVVNLTGANVVISSGTTASAGGCTLAGGSAAKGGAFYINPSGTLTLNSCIASGNSAGDGGCIYCSGGNLVLTDVTFSGNHTPPSGSIGGAIVLRGGNATLTRCSFDGNGTNNGVIYALGVDSVPANVVFSGCSFSSGQWLRPASGASFTLVGENVIDEIDGAGSVVISSGAIIDLTGNTNATSIAPGGGITIPADAIVTILGSGGSSGYFSELALTGSTITNAGLIYGATVTVPAVGGPWEVNTTEGNSTLEADGTEQQVVISGGMSYIGGL